MDYWLNSTRIVRTPRIYVEKLIELTFVVFPKVGVPEIDAGAGGKGFEGASSHRPFAAGGSAVHGSVLGGEPEFALRVWLDHSDGEGNHSLPGHRVHLLSGPLLHPVAIEMRLLELAHLTTKEQYMGR